MHILLRGSVVNKVVVPEQFDFFTSFLHENISQRDAKPKVRHDAEHLSNGSVFWLGHFAKTAIDAIARNCYPHGC